MHGSAWSLLTAVSAIPKLQRSVGKLDCGQDRFIVLHVCHLSLVIVPDFDDMCGNGFGPFAVGERYLPI